LIRFAATNASKNSFKKLACPTNRKAACAFGVAPKTLATVLAVVLNLLLRAGGAEPSEASFNHE
jgi:hypothetical protein